MATPHKKVQIKKKDIYKNRKKNCRNTHRHKKTP